MATSRRGVAAFKQQAKEANDRKLSGFANYTSLKAGEQMLARFRGLIFPPNWEYTESQLQAMHFDLVEELANQLGVAPQDNVDDYASMIVNRYTQVEPFIYMRHYINRNSGKEAYMPCGEDMNPPQNCSGCAVRKAGDKGVSLSPNAVLSVIPRRSYHSVERKGKDKKDFSYCTMEEEGKCAQCKRGHEAKPEGMKYFPLAMMHTAGIVACAERVAVRCACCEGLGKIKRDGYACANPDCGEPLDYEKPDDVETDPQVECPECEELMVPDELLRCTRGCEAPRRVQLFDVDVLIQRLGEGKSTSYSFVEQLPIEPLPEELMVHKIPDYEQYFKPKDSTAQARQLGLSKDPFSGMAASAGPETSSYTEEEDDEEIKVDIPF